MILPDNKVEIDQAEYRPDSHEHIGFRLERVVGKNTRKHQEDQESDQDEQAYAADEAVHFRSFSFLPGGLENHNGREAIDDGCPDRRGVYDPADRRPAEERDRQGDQEHQKNRLNRNLFVIKL